VTKLWVIAIALGWLVSYIATREFMRRGMERVKIGQIAGLHPIFVHWFFASHYRQGTIPLAALDALVTANRIDEDLNFAITLNTAGGRYAEALQLRQRSPIHQSSRSNWLLVRINEAEALANLGRYDEALTHPEAEQLPEFAPEPRGTKFWRLWLVTRLPSIVLVGGLSMMVGLTSEWLVAAAFFFFWVVFPFIRLWNVLPDLEIATLGLAAHKAWVLAELRRTGEARAALAAVAIPPKVLGEYEAEWHLSRFAIAFAERGWSEAAACLDHAARVAVRAASKRNVAFCRGRLAFARGEPAVAIEHFKSTADNPYRHQGGAAFLDWAQACVALGQMADAKVALQRCLAEDPQSPASAEARARLDALT